MATTKQTTKPAKKPAAKTGAANAKADKTKTPAPRRRKEDAAVDRKPARVGAYVSGLLLKGKSTEEILALVGKQFPEAKTSRSSVAWYRSKLHSEGKL